MEGHQQSDDARAGRARILDGKVVSAAIIRKVRSAIDAHVAAGGRRPGLAVVLVGDDPASAIYVNAKRRDCEKAGITARDYDLDASTTQAELLALIDRLNVAYVAVTFPVKSLGRREKGMAEQYERTFTGMLSERPWTVSRLDLPGELVFVVDKR